MKTIDLLLLIKNLSVSEKRNFNLLAKKQSGKANYLVLYKELEKISNFWDPQNSLADFDEVMLERRMKQKNVKGSLPSLKTYLAQSIFKSLRILYEKNNQRDLIEMHTKNAQILEDRGLLNIAADNLKQARDLALEFQYHALALDILVSLVRVETQIDSKSYAEYIKEHLAQMEQLAQFLHAESNHYIQYYHTFLRFRLGTAAIQSPDQSNLRATDIAPNGTFLSEMYQCQTASLNALLSGDASSACEQGKNLLKLWEKNPELKKERLGQYVRQVSNYLNYCIALRKFDDYENYLDGLKELRTASAGSFDNEAELEQNILLAEQLYYLNTDQLEKACELFQSIEAVLVKYKTKISKAREITWRYNQVVALYAISDFENALEHCTNLIQVQHHEHRSDLQLLGKILQIIIHYELRDHPYLNTLVIRLSRLFKNHTVRQDFEYMLLQNLLKLSKIQIKRLPLKEEAEKSQIIFKTFYKELLHYKSNRPPQFRIGFEEIIIWAESKLNGKSFRAILNKDKKAS